MNEVAFYHAFNEICKIIHWEGIEHKIFFLLQNEKKIENIFFLRKFDQSSRERNKKFNYVMDQQFIWVVFSKKDRARERERLRERKRERERESGAKNIVRLSVFSSSFSIFLFFSNNLKYPETMTEQDNERPRVNLNWNRFKLV